ncbi:MAG TPA: EpsI family protein [Bryobacteraceae bacterium]|jgi:EpsI family protein|nr:EpsI family protein [Bryobacteraceae bacterium]
MTTPSVRMLIAVGLLLAQASIYYTMSAKEVIPDIRPWSEFPTDVKGWQAVADTSLEPEVLAALQPDDYLNRDYVLGRQGINLFVGYFNSRRDGRAPHSPEWCLPGSGWTPLSKRVVYISPPGERVSVPVNEYIIDKPPSRAVVVYWYHQGEHETPSELTAQLIAVPDMVLHGRTDTSLVRIIAPVAGDQLEASKNSAFSFAREVYPLIRQQIR